MNDLSQVPLMDNDAMPTTAELAIEATHAPGVREDVALEATQGARSDAPSAALEAAVTGGNCARAASNCARARLAAVSTGEAPWLGS